ncbi:MAG: GNAT family N-acetyltransferase [Lachnospiraceae bacterium]|nr:GNAT family N-acetyltransferase [Lachnospiraceae bacterium]
MLKSVIFDMDGVLVDSEPLHAKAGYLAMKNLGVTIPEQYCYDFIGNTTKYMAEQMIKDFHLSLSVEQILAANTAAKESLIQTEGYPPIPYVKEFIMDLYEHGVTLAVASSSPMDAIKRNLDTLGLKPYFSHLISGMDIPHSKPAPDIFLLALQKLGVNANECLVVEDSDNGVNAAYAAKIPCIGFLNKNSGKQSLNKAQILVEGFDEIRYDFASDVLKRYNGEPLTMADTSRLIIRELSLEDIPALHAIYEEKGMRKFTNDLHPDLKTALEKHKAYIKNIYSFFGYGYWGVFLKDSNKLIGHCGLQNNEINGQMELELGYLISTPYQHHGYAQEACESILEFAFDYLEVPSVIALIDQENIPSQNLAKKLGMKEERSIVSRDRACQLYRIYKNEFNINISMHIH